MSWENSTLGQRIVHICALRGISLSELGRRAGMESGPMSRLAHKDETMGGSPEVLVKLADASEVSLEWLICGRGRVERVQPPLLRANKDWPAAFEEAKRRYGSVPARYFDEVGDAFDTGRPVTWQYVGRSAQILYEADLESERSPTPEVPVAPLRRGRSRGGSPHASREKEPKNSRTGGVPNKRGTER
jgi:transcriptional regulator with XRE-family HTH domain